MKSIGRMIGTTAAMAGVALLFSVNGAYAEDEEGAPSPSGIRLVTPRSDDIEIDGGAGRVSPSRAQRDRISALGAAVRWNRFGTPAVLSGSLSDPLRGTPVQAARRFVRAERTLFRLSAVDVDRLEVVRSTPVGGPKGHIVSFRQRFGRLPAADGGLVTVGLRDSRVTFVSSSAFGSAGRLPAARLKAAKAWLTAAKRLGRDVVPGAVRPLGNGPGGWQRFSVTGLAQEQQVRLVAVGLPARGSGVAVRPAYEVNVVDVQDGFALAATSYVDALTGKVLARHDRVDHLGTPLPGRSVPCAPAWGGCGVRLGPTPDAPLLTALLRSPAPRTGRAVDVHSNLSDAWRDSRCDVGRLERRHATAAHTRVTALQSDLAAWASRLGFPADGRLETSVHSGARTGGYPTFLGRNNAIQVTLQDGLPSITGHYLFEPVAGQWYGRCADGALDPTLVAHEYAHLLVERLVGGPDDQLTGTDGDLLAESWADLLAASYLDETAIGGYVARNPVRGVRNYAVDSNPLNATNRGYAGTGPWSDSEIWTAVNWDLRERLGAHTWIRLLADSLALQQSHTSMPDARDALLAADRLRFGGLHARRIWLVLAQRGLGGTATESGPRRTNTSPSFTTPLEPNGTVRLAAVDAGTGLPVAARLHVGRYSTSTPVADTDPLTGAASKVRMAPGRYTFTWSAPGYGLGRAALTVKAEHTRTLRLRLHPNLAAPTSRAVDTIQAVHGRTGVAALVDDSEETVWTADDGDVALVDLAGARPRTVRSVRVSALALAGERDRFTALRRFAIEADTASGWRRIYTSPASAFPGARPRPVPANLTFRDFDVPDTKATAVRLVPLTNQCTGNPDYHGTQSVDPLTTTDCRSTDAAQHTTVTELMVYDVDPPSLSP